MGVLACGTHKIRGTHIEKSEVRTFLKTRGAHIEKSEAHTKLSRRTYVGEAHGAVLACGTHKI